MELQQRFPNPKSEVIAAVLPTAGETWRLIQEEPALLGQVVTSLLFVLASVFIFFLHRSTVLLTFRRLEEDEETCRNPRKHTLILSSLIPTLSTCFTCATALFPRSCLLFVALGRVVRVLGCYVVLTECTRQCGGSVCVFKLTKLKLDHDRSLEEYKRRHSNLSFSLLLLTLEVFLTLTLHLTLLLLSYNTHQPLYPHNLQSVDPLLLAYYVGLVLGSVAGLVGARKVVGQMEVVVWVPVVVKLVMVVVVVTEVGLSVMVVGVVRDEWVNSVVKFLVTNSLTMAVVHFLELSVIIHLNNKVLYRRKGFQTLDPVELEALEENYTALEDTALVSDSGSVQIHLNREHSIEVLRALNLPQSSFGFDEGIRILLSSDSRRTRQNSTSSIATF